ncbi:hypothetical protein BDZ97DRAFT_1651914 [Flammula alnicola]|nr:hypothetical protein BDZ97DRAFT_1651914 [Flammula alnicola]
MERVPHLGCITIADRLKMPMFPSKTVIAVDSIVICSLYGQLPRKRDPHQHEIQTLATEFELDLKTKTSLYDIFEGGKKNLDFNNPDKYMETARKMAAAMFRESSLLKRAGSDSASVIEWCIAAYAMIINPESTVKLSVIALGPERITGFAIHANRMIKKGEQIYELVGLMPKDNKTKHSELSCVKPNPSQNQSPRVERVLFGPIRFINHVCEIPNAEYIAITDTSAFSVAALRDIAAGEEILVDYGKDWFSDEVDGCPCMRCKPEESSGKRKAVEEDEAMKAAGIKESRRLRRQAKTQKKKIKRPAEKAASHDE